MKRINHISIGTNLIGILLSISIGLALILFSSGRTNAYSAEIVPNSSFISNRIRVQQIYTSQIGVREKQINSGTEVEKYLRYVGLSKGNPWCAAFVCWVFEQAGVRNPRSGWSPTLFPVNKVIWTRAERGKLLGVSGINPIAIGYQESRLVGAHPKVFPHSSVDGIAPASSRAYPPSLTTDNEQPTTSDVFGLFFSEKARIAHVGFIDQWDGTWMISVEGNTNISGSREGDGVYRKRRLVKTIYKVARYVAGIEN